MIFDHVGTEVMGTRSYTRYLTRLALSLSSAASQREASSSFLEQLPRFVKGVRDWFRFMLPVRARLELRVGDGLGVLREGEQILLEGHVRYICGDVRLSFCR